MDPTFVALLFFVAPLAGALLMLARKLMSTGRREVAIGIAWIAVVGVFAAMIGQAIVAADANDTSAIIPIFIAVYMAAVLISLVWTLRHVEPPHPMRESRLGGRIQAWLLILSPLLLGGGYFAVVLLLGAYLLYFVNRAIRLRQATLMTLMTAVVDADRPFTDVFRVVDVSDPFWSRRFHFLLRFAARRISSNWTRRANLFAQDLIDGLPVSDAAEHSRVVAPQDVDLLRAAELADAFSRELPRIASRARGERNSTGSITAAIYIPFLFTFISLLVFFLMYFIVPKFKSIFEDFGVELPELTSRLITAADLTESIHPILSSLIAVLLFVVAGTALLARVGPSGLPISITRVVPRRWTSPTVLRVLGTFIESEMPLSSPTGQLAKRSRYEFWQSRWEELEQTLSSGANLSRVLTITGDLTEAEAAGLDAAELAGRTDGQAAFLRATAAGIDHRVRRIAERCHWCLVAVWFAALSYICFFVAAGFFLVVVKMINDLS